MAETSLDIVINAVDNASSKLGGIGKLAGGIAVAGVAALGAATVAVGKHAFDMAMEFDSALDSITVSTGASGAALDEMGKSVKALYTTAAGRGQSLSSIADVMGVVAARTELAGKPLEALTGQMLKLSNLTGTDAATNVEGLTRLMNQFGVAAEDSAAQLDLLYAGTQATGLGFDQLLSDLQTLAPITQAFGLSLDETVGFLDVLTAAGITAAQAQTGLKSAIVAMREDGIEPSRESFASLIDAVNGPNGLNEAIDLFGTKAGPAFFQAIRDGKIDIDSLSAALGPEGMTGSIDEAIAATEDYPDKWEDAKHRIDVALSDVGQYMLDFLNEYGPPFADWFAATVPAAIDKSLKALDAFIAKVTEAGSGSPGKGILERGSEYFNNLAGQSNSMIGRGILGNLGETLGTFSDYLYPPQPEQYRYPSGGTNDVPYYDQGYDPNAGAGAETRMIRYDAQGNRYQNSIYIYGNATSQDVANGLDQALQGQGVR